VNFGRLADFFVWGCVLRYYDAGTNGKQVGNALTNSAFGITNGLFTVILDFGNQFGGSARWLEIGVRTNGNGAFNTRRLLAKTALPRATA
jgi:hypothetical protein